MVQDVIRFVELNGGFSTVYITDNETIPQLLQLGYSIANTETPNLFMVTAAQ